MMNNDTGGNRALRARAFRPTWPRRSAALAAMAGIALLAAACGSSPTSSNPGSSSSDPSGGTRYQKLLSFSQCMRTHGVPSFPDPTVNGDGSMGFRFAAGGANGKVDPNSSQMQGAEQSCRHLLPNGGLLSPAQRQQALNQALKFSQCMRTHGVPKFPDPTSSGGGITLRIGGAGVDTKSPQFQAAQRACQSLQPGPKGNSGSAGTGSGQTTGNGP